MLLLTSQTPASEDGCQGRAFCARRAAVEDPSTATAAKGTRASAPILPVAAKLLSGVERRLMPPQPAAKGVLLSCVAPTPGIHPSLTPPAAQLVVSLSLIFLGGGIVAGMVMGIVSLVRVRLMLRRI